MRKQNIHFCGGEGINWALDHDLERTIQASTQHAQAVDINDAELIHSVWWRAAARLPEKVKKSRRVIGCFADDPRTVFSDPDVLNIAPYMTAWICEYRDSLELVRSWGLPAFLVPSVVDTERFKPAKDRREKKEAFCRQHGIDLNAYLIGNFHRDSSAENLKIPKRQKGADGFLEILDHLVRRGNPVHVVLVGPRRHYLRKHLTARNVPFTYVGDVIEGDDRDLNTVSHDVVRDLMYALDLYLVTSRWEGAPNAVLETAATRTPVLSSRVGQAPDILTRRQIYNDLIEALQLIEADIKSQVLQEDVKISYEHIHKHNTFEAVAPLLRHLHSMVMRLPVNPQSKQGTLFGRASGGLKRYATGCDWVIDEEADAVKSFILPKASEVEDRDRSVMGTTFSEVQDVILHLPGEEGEQLQEEIEAWERSGIEIRDVRASDEELNSKVLALWVSGAGGDSRKITDALKRGIPVIGSRYGMAHELGQLAYIEWKGIDCITDLVSSLREFRDSLGRLAWPRDNDEIESVEHALDGRVQWK
ncbi:MAG: glycosyltransferase [Verrucomicrobiota bacterium]